MSAYILLDDATAIGYSEAAMLEPGDRTVQVKGSTTAGTGQVTVEVYVSLFSDWPYFLAGTVTLDLSTTEASFGGIFSGEWEYIKTKISAISGTGAKASVAVGV